jgi:hypothetical protein
LVVIVVLGYLIHQTAKNPAGAIVQTIFSHNGVDHIESIEKIARPSRIQTAIAAIIRNKPTFAEPSVMLIP